MGMGFDEVCEYVQRFTDVASDADLQFLFNDLLELMKFKLSEDNSDYYRQIVQDINVKK